MRNLSVDILKVLMAFLVVFLHLNIFMDRIPLLGFVLVNGLFRISVPVFLLISGYYFTQVDSVAKLEKWVFRLGTLYLIWMLIYLPFWINAPNKVLTLLTGTYHLWYLVGALFAGLLLYVLRKVSIKFLMGMAVALFLIGYLIQIVGNLHIFQGSLDGVMNTLWVYRSFLLFCFPMLTLGFVLRRIEPKMEHKPLLFHVVAAIVLLVLESFLLFVFVNSRESVDLLLFLLIAAPVLFLYVKNLHIPGSYKGLADFATGVYLVHFYAIILSEQLAKHYPEIPFGKIGILTVTCIAAFVLMRFKKKIPYVL
ncbi:acyltransferase family protein [Sphingobacterium gobiense]|uniref:Acyltransferase 3 domain-containing protein n=1 Tax=Sphingobacterium gobiense TaxID=1382456 RepID=A0A2S9JTA6_9SPHI|nr:acyltransferase family protein [Sphingobacterium gobiense]PRD56480.1 hypothetical protein C5749_04340 [Sphingobacterium gobiense]